MLSVVERHLVRAGIRCSTIRGDVPPKKRSELVDSFNNDPRGAQVCSSFWNSDVAVETSLNAGFSQILDAEFHLEFDE